MTAKKKVTKKASKKGVQKQAAKKAAKKKVSKKVAKKATKKKVTTKKKTAKKVTSKKKVTKKTSEQLEVEKKAKELVNEFETAKIKGSIHIALTEDGGMIARKENGTKSEELTQIMNDILQAYQNSLVANKFANVFKQPLFENIMKQ